MSGNAGKHLQSRNPGICMMGTQDDDDIGSFAAVRRDLMKAVGDAQTKPTHPKRLENRGARNTVVTKK